MTADRSSAALPSGLLTGLLGQTGVQDEDAETDSPRKPMDLHKALIDISEGLEEENVKTLKFLCRDHISVAKLEKARNALDIFDVMEKTVLISKCNQDFLLECLGRLHRFDLVKKLNLQPEAVKAHMSTFKELKPFRVLLMDINDQLDEKEVDSVRFLLHGLIRRKPLHGRPSLVQLFVYMEQEGLLGENNVDHLKRMMMSLRRKDLVNAILEFQARTFTDNRIPHGRTCELENGMTVYKQGGRVVVTSGISQPLKPAQNLPSNAVPASSDLPAYKMDRKPRGFCVVINNEKFSEEPGGFTSKIPYQRVGTEQDVKAIESVFGKMGFIVRRYDNLNDQEMSTTLINVADEDHTPFDCFVCFILTHGQLGQVFGSNSQLISIFKLTGIFQAKESPTLAKKPKLFFIQACQGEKRMEAWEDDLDGPIPGGSAVQGNDPYQQDVVWEREMVPEEADDLDGPIPGGSAVQGNDPYQQDGNAEREMIPDEADDPDGLIPNGSTVLENDPCELDGNAERKMIPDEADDPDGPIPSGSTVLGNDPYQQDDDGDCEMIPDEADFLLGYATVPGYCAVRDRNYGSWYVRKLCEMLEEYADRYDLMTILVEVNREVAQYNAIYEGELYKQMPAPFVTLTKQLYFR